ncbi:unnamed protein product [Closterium sp. NIES-54]
MGGRGGRGESFLRREAGGKGRIEVKFRATSSALLIPPLESSNVASAAAAASLSAPVSLRVPIVALTADVDRRVVQRCAEGGFDGVLQKPVDAHLLAAHLSQMHFHRSLRR